MKIVTEYPFDNYNGYTMINREDRRMVHLVDTITKERTTISYARYLMALKEKRILERTEQTDHIDGDKTNDNIENLQILSILENNRKRHNDRGTTLRIVKLICPNCENFFVRRYGNTFLAKKGFFSCCSRKCLHEFLKISRSKEHIIEIGKNQVIEIFRR